jgi:hypothetical protein
MKLLAAVIVALAFPATAWGEATLVTRELPVNGVRTLNETGVIKDARRPGRLLREFAA